MVGRLRRVCFVLLRIDGCLLAIAVHPGQVLAARPGMVVALCSHFGEGGMKRRLRPRANFVALRHGDGTYTRYVHLLRNGVLVRLGQVKIFTLTIMAASSSLSAIFGRISIRRVRMILLPPPR